MTSQNEEVLSRKSFTSHPNSLYKKSISSNSSISDGNAKNDSSIEADNDRSSAALQKHFLSNEKLRIIKKLSDNSFTSN